MRPRCAVRCFQSMRSRAAADPRPRRAHATTGDGDRRRASAGRLRIRKAGEQCRKAVGQLLELSGVQASHRPLQCSDSAAGGCAQNLLPIRSGMNLHTSLIALMPSPLDPTACDKSFQDVARRRPLHSEACGESRSGNTRLFTDARKSAMHRDGRVGHAFELAIQRTHAVDERARRQQRIAFERAAARETGCDADESFSW
jgi:hypothetical protein